MAAQTQDLPSFKVRHVKIMSGFTRAGTNTSSDEYDSYREYRVANTNMYSRIHFFSEAKLGNGLSVLLVCVRLYDDDVLRSED